MEGGQGIHTGIATLVAEELGADWSQIFMEAASGSPALYGNLVFGGTYQLTAGSTGLSSSWQRYRQAGAVARTLLTEAAADVWGVPAGEIQVAAGELSHPSGVHGKFADFVVEAATMTPPQHIELKQADDWTLIGNDELRRPDTAEKTRGQQDYTIDVQLPGMLTAVLKRPPRFGATLKSYNAESISSMPGVVDVVATPRGVAVVADSYWEALKARDQLQVEWDEGDAENRSSVELMDSYRRQVGEGEGDAVHSVGNIAKALKTSRQKLDAEFEFPYLAHAAMEPLNAVARFDNGVLRIWAGHQMPDFYQQLAADIMGIAAENVRLHTMMAGGFFGRRATPDGDVIVEAVAIVKAMGDGVPVRVQWSREDDMTGGYYRPMYFHKVEAALDDNGKLSAWKHHVVGQSIMGGTLFDDEVAARNGIDSSSVEGIDDMPYAIPNFSVRLTTTDVGVPVLWWRSVGHSHTAFAVETVIDDLARMAHTDPVAFRRELLAEHPRHLGVLELAAKKAGWSEPLAPGRHRGIAVHKCMGSYVAEVAEVSVTDGDWKVERVVCAVDCGVAVNPDIVRAQMEGCIGFALAAIKHGEISLTDGVVDQDNYDTHPILRIDEMPVVEVHIVKSTETPTGVGEPGVPPLGPAVSNALIAATGTRKRTLPLGKSA